MFRARISRPDRQESIMEAENMNNEGGIPQVLADFLDAETVQEKYRILEERSSEIDEHSLLSMEISLDIVPDDKKSIDDRIGYIMYYLRTRQRFEGTRLRF